MPSSYGLRRDFYDLADPPKSVPALMTSGNRVS
jgi:hypothetical protein